MAYLDRLQINNTNLQNCINKVNALPDAGSSEEVNIETCGVEITVPSAGELNSVVYIGINDDGTIDTHTTYGTEHVNPFILNNIPCGSFIQIDIDTVMPEVMVTNDVVPLDSYGRIFTFIIHAEPGTYAGIDIRSLD